jgi:hypothetical protein
VPDALLLDPVSKPVFTTGQQARARYLEYFLTRLREPRAFVETAARAQREHAHERKQRRSARR